MTDPARIELTAARAWPAAETAERGGWLLRHTPSAGRRRSNSALPLPGLSVGADGVAAVEAWYRDRGAPAAVQVAPADDHAELDGLLAARGWTAGGATDVLVVDAAAVAAGAPAGAVREGFTEGWLAAWAHAEGRPDADGHRGILAAVPAPAGFAVVRDGVRPLAVGLCAVESGWGGVFCLATAPDARRRGLARGVLAALAAWGAGRGAARLYVQVESGNAAAQALFASAGFLRSHGYHYRTAPLS